MSSLSQRELHVAQAADDGPQQSSLRWLLAVIRTGPVLILAILILGMALASPVFLTARNLQNLGEQSSVVAILSLGMLLVIVTRGIDLSVGSVVALSGVLGALVANANFGNGALVILTMALCGALVGFVNGGLFVYGRIPHPFIVTLATLGIVRGLALLASDGGVVLGVSPAVEWLGGADIGPIPVPVLFVVTLAAFTAVFISKTQWGRWIYAVGGEPEAAKRAGVPVGRVVMSVYVLCGLAAGLGGLVTAGRTGVGAPTAGNLLELDAITAVIVGGASFLGGRGNVGNALVGALILGVIRNGMNLLGVSSFGQLVAIGVLVLVAVELDVLRLALERRLRAARAIH
jgi:ribose transport system permease protein